MSKMICTFFKLLYSLLRFIIMKLFHFRHFKFSLINVVSPFTKISLEKGGELTLGKPARIRSGTKLQVRKGAKLTIGDNTFINHNCYIYCHLKITIGKDVQIGPQVFIYDHDHDYLAGLKKEQYICSEVVMGDHVWVGANTIILRGTKIGNNCVIGAGSVIKGEFPDNSIIIQKRTNTVYPMVHG